MNFQSLLAANKTALFTKLDAVQKIKELYVANDIINVLSSHASRDLSIISAYSDEEVKIFTTKRATGLKAVRFFTRQGLIRYLHEGKLINYQLACEYFGVAPLDKQSIEFANYLRSIYDADSNKYKTSTLLRWLFNKRKTCKSLGDYTTINDVLDTFGNSDEIDESKLNYLKTMINQTVTSSL